jgi:hypothetical protein
MEPDVLDHLYTVTKGNHTTTLILPWMVQSVGEVFSLSGKIQRQLSKTGSRDNTKISQEDAPLFEQLGGLELNSKHPIYDGLSDLHTFLVEMEEKLGWNRGFQHLISFCDPPQLIGGPPTKVTFLHGRISSFPCNIDLSLLPKLVKTIKTRN